MKTQQIFLIVIIIATIISIWVITQKQVVLGLDLKGGVRVMLEAQTSKDVPEIKPDIMESFQAAMEKRVNALGVAESVVQPVGEKRLMIELPGFNDPEKAKEYIGKTAKLEFKELVKTDDGKIEWVDSGVTGKDLKKAMVGADATTGAWKINFEMNAEGAKKFQKLTKKLIGKPLGIFFNGEEISAPTVQAVISQGGEITGDFSHEDAKNMVDLLNAGALPVSAEIIEENTVGPSLGEDSLNKSWYAGMLGLAIVALFMLGYYRLPGFVADIALVLYALFTFAIFMAIPVTLTLAGIAGFILSIGMAVDANILIFERTKEEIKLGRTLYTAIETGFDRAFTSIFDSNVTTLISCSILFALGTGMVKGFALTLAIGVIVSMFTAITVTKTLLHIFCGAGYIQKPWLFGVKQSEISETKKFEETKPRRAKMGVLDKKDNKSDR
ncbi:MAG: protein translocase subunit SecD [Cyanobacteriota bacterium]